MKRPVLSIGMIVKNEEKKLEKCLRALQPLRDAVDCELVIADTGSKDSTREIAAIYADALLDVEWENDFSAARNAVMDAAQGRWFLTVDADEYLDTDCSELKEFLTSRESEHIDFCTVIVRNYKEVDMDGDYADFPALRMVRMATGVRYQGNVHERWVFENGAVYHHLGRTVFHHDGYAFSTTEEWKKKARRNLTLLEQKLAERPDDGLTLLQCMESGAAFLDESVQYSHRGMELIQRIPRITNWEDVAGPICRKAVEQAARYKMPEWEEWLDWGESTLPDSAFKEVDLVYYRLLWLYQEKRYEQIIEMADCFLAAWEAFHAGKYNIQQFTITILYCVRPYHKQFSTLIKGSALAALGDQERAFLLLQSVSLEDAPQDLLDAWLNTMENIAYDENAAELLAACVEPIFFPVKDNHRLAIRRRWIVHRIAKAFLPGQDDGRWRIYEKLPTDQGRGAQLYDTEDAVQAKGIMLQIENWGAIPPTVIGHALGVGASLPDAFYRRSAQKLWESAEMLVQYDSEHIAHLLQWLQECQKNDGLSVLCFGTGFLTAALRRKETLAQPEAWGLCIWYGRFCGKYLRRLYRAEVLDNSGENLPLLPSSHQFAWHFLAAQQAAKSADWEGCIHALHRSLISAPEMKHLVAFLLECAEKKMFPVELQQELPELLELTEKIRTILAAYPPDDPLVMQIKASPSYQKVAFLIDN